MSEPQPFQTLYDPGNGSDLPLPERLLSLYGHLQFPLPPERPYILCNFVSTLDGVVTLNTPGHSGGGDISGFNLNDQLLMGILRAAADAVIVGASQLRSPPGTMWTPEQIFPSFLGEYDLFRANLGKKGNPLQVILTASGEIDLSLPIFQSGKAPVLILTTGRGREKIESHALPNGVRVVEMKEAGPLSARQILEEVQRIQPGSLYLIEGGPHLVRYFLEEGLLDELFLTLAPQVAGRTPLIPRAGFVEGAVFAPDHPCWAELVGVKQAGSHLFLRYAFRPVRSPVKG